MFWSIGSGVIDIFVCKVNILNVNVVSMHLLFIERTDWLKLLDRFNVRDTKSWQRWLTVRFPVRVCALNLLFINIFYDVVARKRSDEWLKQNMSCWSVNSCDVSLEKLHSHWSVRAFFPRKLEIINRPTRHILLYTATKINFQATNGCSCESCEIQYNTHIQYLPSRAWCLISNWIPSMHSVWRAFRILIYAQLIHL